MSTKGNMRTFRCDPTPLRCLGCSCRSIWAYSTWKSIVEQSGVLGLLVFIYNCGAMTYSYGAVTNPRSPYRPLYRYSRCFKDHTFFLELGVCEAVGTSWFGSEDVSICRLLWNDIHSFKTGDGHFLKFKVINIYYCESACECVLSGLTTSPTFALTAPKYSEGGREGGREGSMEGEKEGGATLTTSESVIVCMYVSVLTVSLPRPQLHVYLFASKLLHNAAPRMFVMPGFVSVYILHFLIHVYTYFSTRCAHYSSSSWLSSQTWWVWSRGWWRKPALVSAVEINCQIALKQIGNTDKKRKYDWLSAYILVLFTIFRKMTVWMTQQDIPNWL